MGKSKNIKKLLMVVICMCLIISIYGIYREFNPIIMSAHGDFHVAENLKDLESRSEIILRVKITEKSKEYIEFDEWDNTPSYGHTLTDVEVLEVISGDVASSNNIISVYEPYFYYRVFGVQNYLMTVENYKPLTQNKEYILFLRDASSLGENTYYIESNQYGKYIIENSSSANYTAKSMDVYEVSEDYERLYLEVSDKYMK